MKRIQTIDSHCLQRWLLSESGTKTYYQRMPPEIHTQHRAVFGQKKHVDESLVNMPCGVLSLIINQKFCSANLHCGRQNLRGAWTHDAAVHEIAFL